MFRDLYLILLNQQQTFFGLIPSIAMLLFLSAGLFRMPDRTISLYAKFKGVQLFAAAILACFWVSAYRYRYNVDAFNTQGINIWAFSLWVLGGYVFLRIYAFVGNKLISQYLRIIVSWLFYFSCLLVMEYIGYYTLQIRESSARPGDDLLFGLIHGTKGMHVYYVLYPFFIITVYTIILRVWLRFSHFIVVVRDSYFSRKYKTWP